MTDRRQFIKAGLVLGAGIVLLRGAPVLGRIGKDVPRSLLDSFPRRSPYLTSRPDGDGLVLVPSGHEEPAYRLNKVASAIWELCNGRHSPRQIAKVLTGRFEVSEDDCLKDVLDFLSLMHREGLISV
ncbi:MAG: hypothetical protein DRP94_03480 [Candidatus Latescibacterota bacterium]|nr:MAG: hypothetical protein DRP94_03480 [Candidatus Latescibacterota bacterium]RKY73496.1 MAG: hypothetical protein DRQ14_04055 [Candidatus Latescibacterota bacterium]